MNNKWTYIILLIFIVVISCVLIGPFMSNVEQPKYQVISSQENIEIRKYDSMVIAEVEIQAERKEAIKDGFKILADYIFGNNKSKENISMTAPVRQQKVQENWQISFIMPSEYNIKTLPKPANKNINIKTVADKKYIVINFSGRNSDQNIKLHEKKIKKYIAENEIQVLSTPIYAFYNPPWTLPFLRHNEIMMEIR